MKNQKNTTKRPAKPATRKAAGPKEITLRDLDGVIADTRAALEYFLEYENVSTNLTGKERLRLIKSNVRNAGFIDKAFDLARDNPQFLPGQLTIRMMTDSYQRFELLRQWVAVLDQAQRVATDAFYQQSDTCFRLGLLYYGNLRLYARNKVQGAITLFEMLKSYFSRTRRKNEEPTEKQIEKDAKKLLKGKADGAMLIENQRPVTIDGEHKVIDDVRTGNDTAKVVEKIA